MMLKRLKKFTFFFVGFNQQRTHSYKVLRKQFYWCVTHFSYPPSLALSLESDVIHHCEEVFKIDWINTFFYSFLHSLNWTWEALEQKSNEQRSILLNLKYTRVEEAFILITESNFKRVSRCGNHLIKFRVWMIFFCCYCNFNIQWNFFFEVNFKRKLLSIYFFEDITD